MYHRKLILITILLASLWAITGCSALSPYTSGLGAPPAASAAPPAAAAAPTTAAAVPTVATRQPAAAPTLAPTSDASKTVVAAIQAVILKANHEQEQAVAAKNPKVMRDTATASYYTESVSTLNDLLSSGITAIKLDKLTWGPITQPSPTTGQATTHETWSTTFSDGSTLQQTDTNVYTMVLQNGTWLVQQDEHPNSRTLQPPPGAATPVAPTTPLPLSAPGQSQSRNWSGYAATSGTFTGVSGSWIVPNVSSATDGMDATWVGIGGVNSRNLVQAGTQAIVQSGQVAYTAWYETLPQAAQTVPMTVNAGDSVSVSVTQKSNGVWQVVIKDATDAQSYQTSVTYASTNSSAEWIEESPATGHRVILPLDSFGKITFSNAMTIRNGKQVTLKQAGGHPITMYTSGQRALAEPSAVGANGSSFTVTRSNVPAPILGPGGRRFSGPGNTP